MHFLKQAVGMMQAVTGADTTGLPLAAAPLPDLGHGKFVAAREHLLALMLVMAAARRGYCRIASGTGAGLGIVVCVLEPAKPNRSMTLLAASASGA